MQRRKLLGLLAAPVALRASDLLACLRVFVNDRKGAKVVARSMDLPGSFPERAKFFVLPRGAARRSDASILPGITAKVEGVGSSVVSWTSRFGSVAMVSYDGAASDGLNEKGLAVNLLVLEESQHEPKDGRPDLSDTHWAQYVLDNFATVNEVVEAHRAGKFRVVAGWSTELGYPKPLGFHLSVADPSGDSAIFEFVRGKLVIHHGPEFRVMTNDPNLDDMLERMKKYREFGGAEGLPGESAEGEPRFARLAAHYRYLPDAKTEADAVAGALSLLRIAQVPLRDPARAPANEHGIWAGMQTNWVSALDVTNRVYYVNSTRSPSLFWLELKDANFKPGASLLYLDPHDPLVSGDARRHLQRWKAST